MSVPSGVHKTIALISSNFWSRYNMKAKCYFMTQMYKITVLTEDALFMRQ